MVNYDSDLKSSNPDTVIFSLYTLLHDKSKNVYIDRLIELSQSNNDKIRIAAIMVIAKIKNKKLIPILEKLLDDKMLKIKIIAAISLANYLNEKAIPVLEMALNNDINDHSLHKRSIEALGKYKKDEFLIFFEKMITHRRKASRIKAIDVLTILGTNGAIKILKTAEPNEMDDLIKERIKSAIRMLSKVG